MRTNARLGVRALLLALCTSIAPHAQTTGQSRVTGTIALAVDVRETPRKLLHADSPVIACEYLREVPLDTTSARDVYADLVGDTAGSIDIPADLTAKWKKLVQEADAMFGARHYNEYHFLLTLSDRVAHFGLEHHQSNDSRVPENSLTQPNAIGVVAYEYVHSWNGKFRRPAGLATPNFQQPMIGDMLL